MNAKEMNAKELSEILARHTEWLACGRAIGDARCANLRGANLCGANLCGEDLSGANLIWANLSDHEHCEGPFCWILEDVRLVGPFATHGAQGLWEFDVAGEVPT